MKSIVEATVKIVIEHEPNVDPCDVVNDCLYTFEASVERGDEGTITDTEIREVENKGEIDPTTGALKPACANCGEL